MQVRAWVAIAMCAALPVLTGILVTAGTFGPTPPVTPPAPGHWVYVPSRGAAVHVDGAAKGVDATVSVGSANAGSLVLQDPQSAYLVDYDRVVAFSRGAGVTGDLPASGVAEDPVPVEADGAAYVVYRTAGLIVRLGSPPVTVSAGGPLGAPAITPAGQLWVHRKDTGEVCLLTGADTLSCPARLPADRPGALAVVDGSPVFVDATAGSWQPLSDRGTGAPVPFGVRLPANAAVGATAVAGRLPIVDPGGHRLLLIAARAGVITVPLGTGHFGRPVATGGAVVILNTDTGELTSYDGNGRRRASVTVAGGGVRLTTGSDGRAYADSTDGLQSVVMDHDGTLTTVRTTADKPPSYQQPAPVPSASRQPATIAPTTTETIPPVPETVTVQAPPTTTAAPTPGTGTRPPAASTAAPTTVPTTVPAPGPPPGRPTIDVLSAAATGPEQASIEIRVSGAGPVFCHVYFNSVERAATACSGTMRVTANGLAPGTLYDIYVLGTNAQGTGIPGRRAELQL